jgi:uncharacterized membrane protein
MDSVIGRLRHLPDEAQNTAAPSVVAWRMSDRGANVSENLLMEPAMLPDPLHPAVVHFPIVLSFLLPVAALAAIWRIRHGAPVLRAWAVSTAVAAALTVSTWVSVRTGEADEERIEDVVPASQLDAHEEAAERFLVLSVIVLAVTGVGLLGGPAGSVARLSSALGATALVAAGALVGHSGGQLVYRHGAAAAYTAQAPDGANAAAMLRAGEREQGDED